MADATEVIHGIGDSGAIGIGFGVEFTEGVVAEGGFSLVGVVDRGFTTQFIVMGADNVACGVFNFDGITAAIVAVLGDAAEGA